MSDEIYTFTGRDANDALRQAKAELGPDAVLLETRRLGKERKGMLNGFLGGEELVEVVVSRGRPETPARPRGKSSLLERAYAGAPALAPPGNGDARRCSPRPEADPRASADGWGPQLVEKFEDLREELRGEMRRFLSSQARGGLPAVGDTLLREYQRLVENDVAGDIARNLVEHLQKRLAGGVAASAEEVEEALRTAVARLIPTAGPITLREGRPTVVALVGPTGVGKTTTIARLAVDLVYKQGKSVGILNEDVVRPGAQEQLRNLTTLLQVPVVAAEDAARAREALGQMTDRDVVFVDTAGRVARDAQALRRLGAYLEAVEPDETHLVVSSECAEKVALDVLRRFRAVGYDRVLLSKLDEAVSYGLILNIAVKVREGISYVTAGQEYAESVRPGDAACLARLVLGQERADAGR